MTPSTIFQCPPSPSGTFQPEKSLPLKSATKPGGGWLSAPTVALGMAKARREPARSNAGKTRRFFMTTAAFEKAKPLTRRTVRPTHRLTIAVSIPIIVTPLAVFSFVWKTSYPYKVDKHLYQRIVWFGKRSGGIGRRRLRDACPVARRSEGDAEAEAELTLVGSRARYAHEVSRRLESSIGIEGHI